MFWKKPSGLTIELNDAEATIKKAEELGWVREGGNLRTETLVAPGLPELEADSFSNNPATSGAITQEEKNE